MDIPREYRTYGELRFRRRRLKWGACCAGILQFHRIAPIPRRTALPSDGIASVDAISCVGPSRISPRLPPRRGIMHYHGKNQVRLHPATILTCANWSLPCSIEDRFVPDIRYIVIKEFFFIEPAGFSMKDAKRYLRTELNGVERSSLPNIIEH